MTFEFFIKPADMDNIVTFYNSNKKGVVFKVNFTSNGTNFSVDADIVVVDMPFIGTGTDQRYTELAGSSKKPCPYPPPCS